MQPLFEDGANFKVQTCRISGYLQNTGNKMLQTDCDSAGGDSGAPLLRGNTIVALNNSGPQSVFQNNESNGAVALNTENFYQAAQDARQKINDQTTPPSQNKEPVTSKEEPPTGTITDPAEIQRLTEQRLNDFQCD